MTACEYCETMHAHRLPDHAVEVYTLARADALALEGMTYERALNVADTIARRVARHEIDHAKLGGHWMQLAAIRRQLAELVPDELADHLEANGNPEGAARVRQDAAQRQEATR